MFKLLITADLHLRDDKPRARTDEDWFTTQKVMLKSIIDIGYNHEVDAIAICGDIFHHSTVSPKMENLFLEVMGGAIVPVYIMPGQHDLPYHNIERITSSSFGVMFEIAGNNSGTCGLTGMGYLCEWVPYGKSMVMEDITTDILALHQLITPHNNTLPNVKTTSASDIAKQYCGCTLVMAGDYHHGHIYKRGDTKVVVPGCAIRQKASELNCTPSVVIVTMDDDSTVVDIEKEPITDIGEITDEYVNEMKDRTNRLEAFLEATKKGNEVTLSFEDNVEQALVGQSDLVKNKVHDILFMSRE